MRELLNDTLEVRGLAVHGANDGDDLVQLDVGYRLRSNVVLRAGYDLFHGSTNGLFGQFDETDRVGLGVEVRVRVPRSGRSRLESVSITTFGERARSLAHRGSPKKEAGGMSIRNRPVRLS
ncbi:MAG: hypothetical protein ACREQ9_04880 [Candidatus Binatia bacterium]